MRRNGALRSSHASLQRWHALCWCSSHPLLLLLLLLLLHRVCRLDPGMACPHCTPE
jgi:hypothetical protein